MNELCLQFGFYYKVFFRRPIGEQLSLFDRIGVYRRIRVPTHRYVDPFYEYKPIVRLK